MVLYILTNYWVLSIVYLDQLTGARHTHISNHDKAEKMFLPAFGCTQHPKVGRNTKQST